MKNLFIALVLIAIPHFIYAQTARVQVIHNSADALAATVDVYLDGTLLFDDVDFRTATPFIDAPAGVPLQVDVAPGNSTSVANSVATFTYNLTQGETYVLIAEGILSTTGYNPSTGAAAFDIAVYNMGQESAGMMTNTDVLIHHGATDAPAVDVVEVGAGAGAIVTNASYGDFTGYLALATADYRLEVRATGATAAVGSYEAPLASLGLQGEAIVAIASGFLDPSQNSNGPAFGIWVALPTGGPLVELEASTARAQIIHNSADAAAATVDIYLNDDLLLDDVDFRTASAFVDVPAGVEIKVDVAPGTSTSVANSIATFNYTLAAEETYILVAEGIVSATGYNPSTGAAAFDIAVYNMGQESAGMMTNTDVLVHHGATDAPAVDVVEVGAGAGAIVTNASYGDFAGYLALATADYRLEVRATGATAAVGSYEAPLATLGLQGEAIVAIASGFLDPSQNSNGPAFGIWVALPTGGPLVELEASTARAQIIHNSADAAAATVDIYLNDDLLLDDVDFRTASAFVDVPAGVEIKVDVAPGTSTSVANSIATFNYTLAATETYVLIAEGIVSATGYNPSTGAAAFDIAVYNMGQESAGMMTNTDVLVHHGATDAPAVDVVEVGAGAGAIVTNASYGDFAGYLALATADYRLEVRATGATAAVGSYEAPLASLGLQGEAIVAIASGFLDPSQNSNGPAFGIWVALPTGGPLVELEASTARAQIIHNSADAAAATVDIYLNDDLLLDDVDFRTASAFVDVPAGVEIKVDVAPGTSTSVANSIATFNYTLAAEETYILVAEGIVSATGYNPSTGAAAFDIAVYDMGRETANNATEVDVLVHHGATDAPVVDVRAADTTTVLVDDAAYGDFAGYLSLMDQDYVIRVTDATGATVVKSYQAPLNTLGLAGSAITVLASGFLDPTVNSNGPDFGLWVATAAGGALIALPEVATNINKVRTTIEGVDVSIAPNPVVSDVLQVTINSTINETLAVDVIDVQGKTVISLPNTVVNSGTNVASFGLNDVANGTYFVRFTVENQIQTIPFTVAK